MESVRYAAGGCHYPNANDCLDSPLNNNNRVVNEILKPETERPRRGRDRDLLGFSRDRDLSKVRLETETSRLGIGKSRKNDLNQIKIITEKSDLNQIQKIIFKCDLNQNQIIDQIIY